MAFALARRGTVPHEAEPVEIGDDGRLEFRATPLPIVVLDPKKNPPGVAPDVDRVHDVTEVQEPGRRRRETRYHGAHHAKVIPARARIRTRLDERPRARSGETEAWRMVDIRRRSGEHALLATRSD